MPSKNIKTEEFRKREAERKRLKRLNETNEEAKKRKSSNAERMRKIRQNQSGDKKEAEASRKSLARGKKNEEKNLQSAENCNMDGVLSSHPSAKMANICQCTNAMQRYTLPSAQCPC